LTGRDTDDDDMSGSDVHDWQAGAPWLPMASYPDPIGARLLHAHGVFESVNTVC